MQQTKVTRNFAKRLQAAMNQAGLDGTHLAKKMDVKQATVSTWIRGRSLPQADNLEKVAAVLNQPVAWFFEEGSEVQPMERAELGEVLNEIKAAAARLERLLAESE